MMVDQEYADSGERYGTQEHEDWLIEQEQDDERWSAFAIVPTNCCDVARTYGGDCAHTLADEFEDDERQEVDLYDDVLDRIGLLVTAGDPTAMENPEVVASARLMARTIADGGMANAQAFLAGTARYAR